MATGSGLAGQLGLVAETTYGTAVTVTRFLRAKKANVKRGAERVQGMGIQAGALLDLDSNYDETQDWAVGGCDLDVYFKGMGLLVQALMGTTVTPVQQGTTSAYLQTHTLADPLGKFLTVQAGVPQRGGTVKAKTGAGMRVTKATFKCEAGGHLESTWEFDGHHYDDTIGLAAASYLTPGSKWHFRHMGVKLGTVGAEAAVSGVRGFELAIERPMDVEGFYANNAGRKVEPVLNDRTKISGNFEVDYLTTVDFEERARDKLATGCVVEFIAGSIPSGGANLYTFRFRLPVLSFESETPEYEGPDVVKTTWPFELKWDGTNMPAIEIMSTDTTV